MDVHYIPIFFLLLLSSLCKSDDQLTRAKPLTHIDTLVSESGNFALGFFSTTNSNKSFYLGIWYHNIPGPRTVVWLANRDNPITTPSSVMLSITTNSDLVLSDSKGHHIWRAASYTALGGAEAYALLLNSGNFVLRLPNGTDILQSFDHPTDTILPTMRFLLSYKAQAVRGLVAWKGLDDPSSGDFSCGADPSSPTLQWLMWHGTRPYCRSEVLNGVSMSGGTYLSNASSIVTETAISEGDEFYFMFTVSDGSPFMRLMFDYTGKFKSLSWNYHLSSWAVLYERPRAACDLYASCGPFNYCDCTSTVPTCRCLDGFEPDGLTFSRGCRRTEELNCGKQSHFITLPGMKVPDNFLHMKNRSFDECAAECGSNCSCTAYAYASLSGAGAKAEADPTRCLVWIGELIDAAKFIDSGENLYLRVAESPVDKKRSLLKILLPIISLMLLLTCIALIWTYKYRGKWQEEENQKKLMRRSFSTSDELKGENTEFSFVTYEDILSATNFFADSNLLGQGGFGKVYKGTLEGGYEVAVKRLSKGSGQEMTPKISDFGMARIFGANQNHANTTRVVGTYGYMSPEYAMRGVFCVKTDTYSFGVLLLEIVSGLKISLPQHKTNFCSLITFAWRIWEDGEATKLVDSSIVTSCPLHEVIRSIHVGLLCVQDRPNDRPLMSSVMCMLENENTPLPTPKQPVYFPLSNCEGSENVENSVNAMSVTILEGH